MARQAENTGAGASASGPFTAADLDGLSIADAHRKFVRGDPKVVELVRRANIISPLCENVLKGLFGHRRQWPINYQPWDFGRELVRPEPFYGRREPPAEVPPEVRAAGEAIKGLHGHLIGLCQRGDLIAAGTFVGTGILGDIDSAQWSRTTAWIDVVSGDLLELVGGNLSARWTGLTLHLLSIPDGVRSVDRDRGIKTAETTHGENKLSIKAETACRQWLIELMNLNLKSATKPKDNYLTAAQDKFPGLSERAFDRAWSAAVEKTGAEWDQPGRPTRNPRT